MIADTDGGVTPQSWKRMAARRSSRRTAASSDVLQSALERTRDWLLARQDPEGYWVAELEGDTILESEYILLMTFLGRESDDVCIRCARYIRDHQLPGGGWAIYPGGPTDVSASVKAYFAAETGGAFAGRAGDGAGSAGDPGGRRGRTSVTASRASTWRCWARSTMKNAPVYLRSWS